MIGSGSRFEDATKDQKYEVETYFESEGFVGSKTLPAL